MSYGLRVFKSDSYTVGDYVGIVGAGGIYVQSGYVAYDENVDIYGTSIFDTSSIVWIPVDEFTVYAGTTVTKSYPDFEGWTLKVFYNYLNLPPPSSEPHAPIDIINGTSVTIKPDSTGTSEDVSAIVLARNYI